MDAFSNQTARIHSWRYPTPKRESKLVRYVDRLFGLRSCEPNGIPNAKHVWYRERNKVLVFVPASSRYALLLRISAIKVGQRLIESSTMEATRNKNRDWQARCRTHPLVEIIISRLLLSLCQVFQTTCRCPTVGFQLPQVVQCYRTVLRKHRL